jgi:hypothetical protein
LIDKVVRVAVALEETNCRHLANPLLVKPEQYH